MAHRFFGFVILLHALSGSVLAGRTQSSSQVSACVGLTDLASSLVVLRNVGATDQTLSVKGGMKSMVSNMPDLSITIGNYMSGWVVRGHDALASVTSAGTPQSYPASGALCGLGTFCAGTNIASSDGPHFTLRPGGTLMLQTKRYGSGAHVSFDLDITITEDRGAVLGSGSYLCAAIELTTGNVVGTSGATTAYTINGGRAF